MKRFVGVLVALTFLASVCLLSVVFSQGQSELANQHKIMHRLRNDPDEDKNKDEHPAEAGKAAKARPGSNGITYHGGPVILGTTHIYYIWYGNWGSNTANTILTNLAQNIGGSPYFNINTTYYNGSNVHVSNSVSFGGSTTDNYSSGRNVPHRRRDSGDCHRCPGQRPSALRHQRTISCFDLGRRNCVQWFLHSVLRLAYLRND